MIADLADAKGKVSAFTEFGVTNGVGTSGSSPEQWFTKVLDAIKADPKASRNAYMQTWANFDAGQHYVPVTGDALLPDFLDVRGRPVHAVRRRGHRRVRPCRGHHARRAGAAHRVARRTAPASPRRRRPSAPPSRTSTPTASTPRSRGTEIELSPGDGLWWSAPWDIPAEQLDNSTQTLEVHVVADGVEVLTESSSVVLGPRPTFGPGVVDDYEGYGDDTALRAEYVSYGANTLSLDTQRPVPRRCGWTTTSPPRPTPGSASRSAATGRRSTSCRCWVKPDGSGNKMVLQLVAGGVSYEAYPSLAGTEAGVVTFPFVDWRPAPWDTANANRRITDADLKAISQFNIYVNAADDGTGAPSGSIVVDDIAALPGVEPPPLFSDVLPGSPNFDSIIWLHDQGLDDGYADGTFRPTKPRDPRGRGVAALPLLGGDLRPDGEEADVPRRAQEARLLRRDRVAGAARSSSTRRSRCSCPRHRSTARPRPSCSGGSRGRPSRRHPRRSPTSRRGTRTARPIAWATETGIIVPTSATRYGVLKVVTRGDFAGLPRPVRPPAEPAGARRALRLHRRRPGLGTDRRGHGHRDRRDADHRRSGARRRLVRVRPVGRRLDRAHRAAVRRGVHHRVRHQGGPAGGVVVDLVRDRAGGLDLRADRRRAWSTWPP